MVLIVSFACSFVLVIFWMLRGTMGIDICKACGRMWDDTDQSFVGQQVFGDAERGPNLCPDCKDKMVVEERRHWDARS
ncbi:MAG: hypothetical protein IPN23_10825 [Elusimicrobia bacterium]|nr:hypothetical protein [Elusimicrobiota bacterium]